MKHSNIVKQLEINVSDFVLYSFRNHLRLYCNNTALQNTHLSSHDISDVTVLTAVLPYKI